MPGIFGVVDLNAGSGRSACERFDLVRQMAASMRSDASYVVDLVSCPALNVCAGRVGWGFEHDTRVLTSPSPGESALLTTGEPVVDCGVSPRLNNDCALIGSGAGEVAQVLQDRGIGGLDAVDRSFAGLLIDQRNDRCVLFNDRYGVERLFVHTQRDRVFFSSEAKAILAVAPSTRALDVAGLAEWMACGCTIGTRSLFHEIEVLPGGTAVMFNAGRRASRMRYFDRSRLEQLPRLPADEFVETFDSSLAAAVRSDVRRFPKAALSLTGGLDSRLIIANLDAAPASVPCYTFGSMYRPTMDVSVAQAVAAACEQPHHVLTLDRSFLTDIDEHFRKAVYASDGYLGLTGSSELYLNALARQVAPARITGNWGGELMRGVRAFKSRMPKGDILQAPVRDNLAEVAAAFGEPAEWNSLSFTLFRQMPYQGFGRYAVERSQVTMRAPFLANNVVKALYQAPPATRASLELVQKVLARRPGLIAVPTDLGRLGQSSRPVAQLRQTFRRALVKAEYLTSHGAPDWMAALSARVSPLERAFLGRDKFQHFRLWMRREISPVVRDIALRDDGLADWFDMRQVSRMVDEHIAGQANYTDELDKVMTVALIRQTLCTGSRPAAPAATQPVREIALETVASHEV
jgi:asparagine synthase (glutamine-hydrolysing)